MKRNTDRLSIPKLGVTQRRTLFFICVKSASASAGVNVRLGGLRGLSVRFRNVHDVFSIRA